MKKLISLVFALIMMFSLGANAFAGYYRDKYPESANSDWIRELDYVVKYEPDPDQPFTVRVDGWEVDFPDAKPFIDNSSRTMVPVRFVAEQLKATVDWNGNTKTASVKLNNTTVQIQIGNANLKIDRAGTKSTVKMDTVAVIKDERTYVPIRFVAEELGCFVDYSPYWHTVAIYSCNSISIEQIKYLRSFPMTKTFGKNESMRTYAVWTYDDVYNQAAASGDPNEIIDVERLYGSKEANDANKQSFENAVQYLQHMELEGTASQPEGYNSQKIQSLLEQVQNAFIDYTDSGYAEYFITSPACVYKDLDASDEYVIRGIWVIERYGSTHVVDLRLLKDDDENLTYDKLKFVRFPVDVVRKAQDVPGLEWFYEQHPSTT